MVGNMPKEHLSDFATHPLYHTLLTSPNVTPQPTASRSSPSHNPTQAHTLLSSTLFTPTGVRAMQSFHLRGPFPSSSPSPSPLHSASASTPTPRSPFRNDATATTAPITYATPDQYIVLISLGTGLNGPNGIVHGGLLMTLLDSAMAVRASHAAAVGAAVVTTGFEARFERKVRGPEVLVGRAWLEGVGEGKEGGDEGMGDAIEGGSGPNHEEGIIWTKGIVENGRGKVYLRGRARFMVRGRGPKAKL